MKIYEIKEIIPLVDHVTDCLSLQYIVLVYTELEINYYYYYAILKIIVKISPFLCFGAKLYMQSFLCMSKDIDVRWSI